MLNEPFFDIFVDVFSKCWKFVLRQIINGSKWGCIPSFKLIAQSYGRCSSNVFAIFFSKTSLWSWYWIGISCCCVPRSRAKLTYTNNAYPYFVAYMNALIPMNRSLKYLDPWLPPISLSHFSFCMCWLILVGFAYAKSCSESNVLFEKNSYFGVVLFIDSKWKLLFYQSTQGLYKINNDKPMMIRFVRFEMTLKTILLLCDPIVIVNTCKVFKKSSDH
jgi:hypothetical protein